MVKGQVVYTGTLCYTLFLASQLIDLTLLFIFVLFVCLFVFLVVIQLSIVGNTQQQTNAEMDHSN